MPFMLVPVIALCLYAAYRVLRLQVQGERATAEVVAVREDHFDDGPVFHPTLRFITNTGETILSECTFSVQEAETSFRVGQQLVVRYAASNPTFFTLDDSSGWGAFISLLIIAASCAAVYWGYLHN